MPNRVVVQPNGLVARFSTIVDHFTHFNCTKQMMLQYYQDEIGRSEAEGKLERGVACPERFDDEIATIKFVHGPLEAERTRKFLSMLDDGKQDISRILPLGFVELGPINRRNEHRNIHVPTLIADYERHIAALHAIITDEDFPGKNDGDDDESVRFHKLYVKELAKLKETGKWSVL